MASPLKSDRMWSWRTVVVGKALLATAVVIGSLAKFDSDGFPFSSARRHQSETPALSSRLSTYDSSHYLELSRDGYRSGSASCAFYPFWPLLLRTTTAATGGSHPVLMAMLLANTLSLIGLLLLYRLMVRQCGEITARNALILLLAFPGALFFSFPYSESLFLVLLMAFFWGLELRRWTWVVVAGVLLPLARPVGIFILLPLAYFFWERGWPAWPTLRARLNQLHQMIATRRRPKNGNNSTPTPPSVAPQVAAPRTVGWAPWLLLAPLGGYAAYFGLMYLWTGNAFEGFAAQKHYPYSPSIANMFDLPAFWSAFTNLQTLDGMMDAALDRGFFLLFLALLPLVRKRNRLWFWYVLPGGLIPPLTSYFMSYRRYIMMLFPLFVVMAQLLTKGPRWMFWYYVILMALLQAWAVFQFVNFNWAG